MFEIKDLRSLVAVYENRHFGMAAEKLGVSQPAISKTIQKMEHDLGFVLFDRSRAKVTPTSGCESVVLHAKQILASVKDLGSTVRLLSGLERGALSIGVGPAMAESYITKAIANLAQDHPGIELDVRVDHWVQLSEWLIEGEIDLMVADLAAVSDNDRFITSALPAEEFTWFCRTDHPLADFPLVTRQDLLKFPLVTPRMPPWATKWFQQALRPDDQKLNGKIQTVCCENYSMLKRIVMESNCISVALSATIISELNENRLTALKVDAAPLVTHAGIVQLRDRTVTPLADAFIGYVNELAKQQC